MGPWLIGRTHHMQTNMEMDPGVGWVGMVGVWVGLGRGMGGSVW